MIGIVGGVGPLAGLDVFKKIIEETNVQKDQDHLPVLLMSYPHLIVDRTEYLVGTVNTNPGYALATIITQLAAGGATVAAIPCNTAHAAPIFDLVKQELSAAKVEIKLLHLVEETVNYIKKTAPNAVVGVLSTTGTRKTGLYKNILDKAQLKSVQPDDHLQAEIHDAIYNKEHGIKAFSSPIRQEAREALEKSMDLMINEGVTHFILGCTELPLAFPEKSYKHISLIDPNRILARALINAINPSKLS